MDKWLKKPVAKKRKHGEFSYFSYINYMTIYPAFYETLCEIENESTGDVRIEAAGHRRLLEDSSFIVSLVSSQYLLGFTRNLTDSLQESNCDLVKAFSDARNTGTVIIRKEQMKTSRQSSSVPELLLSLLIVRWKFHDK